MSSDLLSVKVRLVVTGLVIKAASLLNACPIFISKVLVSQICGGIQNIIKEIIYSLHYHHFIRSRNDCNIDAGVIGTDASFGIKCCPSDRTLDFTNQAECLWLAADSGENLACGEERAAFGRCSTSARSGKGGDCNNVSLFL